MLKTTYLRDVFGVLIDGVFKRSQVGRFSIHGVSMLVALVDAAGKSVGELKG